jgi:hypothetical protein
MRAKFLLILFLSLVAISQVRASDDYDDWYGEDDRDEYGNEDYFDEDHD